MSVHHVFYAVGYDITAGQAVEHSVVSHCNAVINGYRIEFRGVASQSFYLLLDDLTRLMQMGVAGHELCERVDNSDDGLAKLFAFHSIGNPQSAGTCHAPTLGANGTSERVFHILLLIWSDAAYYASILVALANAWLSLSQLELQNYLKFEI